MEKMKYDKMLERTSCVTACLHRRADGQCTEQACLFHYKPGRSMYKKDIKCADSVNIIARSAIAAGKVIYGIQPIPGGDDMIAAIEFANMNDEFKHRQNPRRDTNPSAVKVCVEECHEAPPPVKLSRNDVVYVTVVAVDEDGKTRRHVPSSSFRIILKGSQTGKSCITEGGTLLSTVASKDEGL